MIHPENTELNELDATLGDADWVASRFSGDYGESLGLTEGFVTGALRRADVRYLLSDRTLIRFTSEEKYRIDKLLVPQGLCLRWAPSQNYWVVQGHWA